MIKNKENKIHGKRVRIAITLCGMKLPAFGKKYKISFSHLYAIEKGERTLNEKTAERIASGVRQEGYPCTAKWLLEGDGAQPLRKETSASIIEEESNSILSSLSPELKIMKEAAFFQELSPNSVVSCVLDNGMEPFYSVGDYVGGIFFHNLKDALGKDCIVITKDNEQLIRRFLKGNKKEHYTLACVNPFTKESPAILFDQIVKRVAPIVWHRRRNY
ncbi:MAG: helix-turn-helix domain-containing protein [Alphaproteobacteria bacterium]|nr:helix-turn-helix domain-containing protein [Alphaproteobacteria bacterium]